MTRAPGAAPPPSEREGQDRDERRRGGIGLFGLAGWGWGLTIGLFVFVGAILLVGYIRNDPGRNPAPAAYSEAVCAAWAELGMGVEALAEGVESDDDAVRSRASERVEASVVEATHLLDELPAWAPGEPLNELLAEQIIGLANGATSLRSGGGSEELERVRELDAIGRERLADDSYGFSCDA
ncbi:MAG: hypothetical protein ACRDGD_12565 [Candidatus Limnocylindria bacterium]